MEGVNAMEKRLGVHETLEVHEVMTFKTLCLTKSSAMQGLAQDPALKNLFQQDVQTSQRQINELQQLVSHMNLQ